MRVKRYAAAAVGGSVLVSMGALLVPATAEPPATCNGLAATIVGTDGDDTPTGTDGADVVSLGAGNDRFLGGGGNDTVCGGPGQDSLYGEAGNDWLDGGDDDDYNVIGGPGDDVVHGGAGNERGLLGDGSRDYDGADQVYGDDGDDFLQGETGSGKDTVDGGTGDDRVAFGRGVTIDVAAGTAKGTAAGDVADTLVDIKYYQGSDVADVIIGSPGDDYLYGGDGKDVIDGRAGDDRLAARGGTITGGDGQDTFLAYDEENELPMTVDLGPGDDRAFLDALRDTRFLGGPGDDVFEVLEPGYGGLDPAGTEARLLGGAGEDVLTLADLPFKVRLDVRAGTATWFQSRLTFAHLNEFHGSARDDVLLGSGEGDRLFGQAGDDELRGRGGPDLLRGGTGRDAAYGGPGRDTCTAERRFSCERS